MKRSPRGRGPTVGIIGCGHFVKTVYIPALNRGGLTLVCKSLLSNKVGDSICVRKRLRYRTLCYDRLDRFLNSGLNSIIVTTPNNVHLPYLAAGVERGLHVFCEKPLTVEISEAYQIRDLLENSSSVLMVGFQLRYSDLFETVQNLVGVQAFGKVGRVRVRHFLNLMDHVDGSGWLNDKQKSGGGVLFNAGIHSINLLQALFGDVSQVSATFETATSVPRRGEDTAYCRLAFKGGVSARLTLSYRKGSVSAGEFKIIIYCEKAVLVCDFHKNSLLIKNRITGKYEHTYFHDMNSDLVFKELNHFSYCIDKNLKPTTNIDDYVKTACIIKALYESENEKSCHELHA